MITHAYRVPKYTIILMVACVAVFILQTAFGTPFMEIFAIRGPDAVGKGYIWQFVTSIFLHGDELHLLMNMIILFIFGATVESALGKKRYLTLFFVSGVGANVLYIFLTSIFSPGTTYVYALGASGAIFGIIGAYGLMFPRRWIFIPPGIPLPGIVAVAVFGVLEFIYGISGVQEGVANFAHLGGIIFGVLTILYLRDLETKKSSGKLVAESGEREKDWEYVWE